MQKKVEMILRNFETEKPEDLKELKGIQKTHVYVLVDDEYIIPAYYSIIDGFFSENYRKLENIEYWCFPSDVNIWWA